MMPETSSPTDAVHDLNGAFAPVYKVLADAIAAHAFPGCAFGVLAGGKVVLLDALGRFTYEDNAPAVTPATVYDVASITKVATTTAAAMLLYQRGQLDLETPLGELLPGFVVGRSRGELAHHVRVRHLLAHSSGLPGYAELFRTVSTPTALLRACLQLPLEAAPGTRTEYSDIGFILLGKALEVLTREYLARWVRMEVFEPLGFTATGYCPTAVLRPLIPPTEEDTTLRHRIIQGEVQDEHAWLLQGAGGHAGLFSNVPDLLRFAAEILAAAGPATELQKQRLFNPETIATFATRQVPEGSSRALGWDTPSPESSAGRYFSPHSIGHLGYSGCSLWIDLEAAVSVVLLTNRTWPDRQSQLIRTVRPAFHDAVREALTAYDKLVIN
ncbi:MAG: serine hydrolase domain-containing protein [Terracidiphilus sp.]